MNIDWENSISHVLCNPRYSQADQIRFQSILKYTSSYPGHIWLSTSGSCQQKWVGLSKSAVLASAQSVNDHLESNQEDRWIQALPSFHVGGLGIWARAYLSQAQVFDYDALQPKWNAESFYSYLKDCRGSLSALVPTQLHDLVALKYEAPPTLRALIIGAGSLSPELYEKAITLKWPILPSYGMTECASQIATATLDSLKDKTFPSLQLLSHLQGMVQEECLSFSGSSLFSCYAQWKEDGFEWMDPKKNGWFLTEDRGDIQERHVIIRGRKDHIIKIGGESVDLTQLQALLLSLTSSVENDGNAILIDLPDARLGKGLHLVTTYQDKAQIEQLVEAYSNRVLPFERIRKIHFVRDIPRSPLGKILKAELRDLLILD